MEIPRNVIYLVELQKEWTKGVTGNPTNFQKINVSHDWERSKTLKH